MCVGVEDGQTVRMSLGNKQVYIMFRVSLPSAYGFLYRSLSRLSLGYVVFSEHPHYSSADMGSSKADADV